MTATNKDGSNRGATALRIEALHRQAVEIAP